MGTPLLWVRSSGLRAGMKTYVKTCIPMKVHRLTQACPDGYISTCRTLCLKRLPAVFLLYLCVTHTHKRSALTQLPAGTDHQYIVMNQYTQQRMCLHLRSRSGPANISLAVQSLCLALGTGIRSFAQTPFALQQRIAASQHLKSLLITSSECHRRTRRRAAALGW